MRDPAKNAWKSSGITYPRNYSQSQKRKVHNAQEITPTMHPGIYATRALPIRARKKMVTLETPGRDAEAMSSSENSNVNAITIYESENDEGPEGRANGKWRALQVGLDSRRFGVERNDRERPAMPQ